MPQSTKRRAPIRIDECHDFSWSRKLWKEAANKTARISITLLCLYTCVGYFFLARADGMRVLDSWYYLSATLTTVGIGDFAPSTQVTRAVACFLIPCGLCIVSLVISYTQALALSSSGSGKTKSSEDDTNKSIHGGQKGAATSVQDVIPAHQTNISSKSLFVEYMWLLARFAGVISVGAVFFRFYVKEHRAQELLDASYDSSPEGTFSTVDAIFFSVVISTTVGYGHRIVPVTDAAKIFLIFYMIFATINVGAIVNQASSLYLEMIAEETVASKIIDSTIWTHKSDLDNDGKVTEADYILFKLQQLQKVDADMLERLIRRFKQVSTYPQAGLCSRLYLTLINLNSWIRAVTDY